jgi:hypothetical protein
VGICSLTLKTAAGGLRAIRYPISTRQQKLQTALTVISSLWDDFGKRVNITTIVPASLGNYFSKFNPKTKIPEELAEEQITEPRDRNYHHQPFCKVLQEL